MVKGEDPATWLRSRDIAERTQWDEEFRRSGSSLGSIIQATFKERNIFWEPPKAAEKEKQRARSRSPRRPQPKQPTTPLKVPKVAHAQTSKTLRNGQVICSFPNTAKGCSKGAACPELHVCNAVQKSGRTCGSKQHNNYNKGKGCSNRKVAGH